MTLLAGDSFKNKFTVALNPHLLLLKVCYFLVYAVWISVLPYVALISTQIIDYRQLAILFACIPAISITSPILTAFDAGNTLLDSSGLTMAQKYGGDFGKQKMWGTFAMVVLPILCGYLIDVISTYRGFLDYSVAFFMSTGIAIVVIPIIYKLDIEVKKNEHTMLKTAKKVMGMIDVDVFLLAEIVLGFCWGFHMNFSSVYILTELESSKTLFGAALGIGGFGSMIIISYTKAIISRMGEANTIAFSLMLYAIRFVVYYFLRTPWLVLIVEALEGLSGFLSIVAGSYYCAEAAPPGMLASLNGILASAVFGAGRGLGTTTGSILISAYGIRVTYLIFGIFAGLASITYLTVYHSCLKSVEQRRLEEKAEKEGEKGVENPVMELDGEPTSSVPAISIPENGLISHATNYQIEIKESKGV